MKFFFTVLLIVFTNLFLIACGGLNDAGKILRNEKTGGTDEFLIKKREPLTQPPDFKKLPKPKTSENVKVNKDKNIRDILKSPDTNDNTTSSGATSTEQSIINQIK